MNCPRCERRLDRYSFAGRTAFGCEGCGYVGVAAEHRSSPVEVESWEEALDRFRAEE